MFSSLWSIGKGICGKYQETRGMENVYCVLGLQIGGGYRPMGSVRGLSVRGSVQNMALALALSQISKVVKTAKIMQNKTSGF
jgi:hypothetical protein